MYCFGQRQKYDSKTALLRQILHKKYEAEPTTIKTPEPFGSGVTLQKMGYAEDVYHRSKSNIISRKET